MRKFLCFLLAGLIFLAAGCGDVNDVNKETEDAALTKLTIAAMPSIDKVPILVGVERGFFTRYGVEVEVLNFQSPTDRDAAVQSGQADGIMSDMAAALYYMRSGQKLKMTSQIQTDFVVLAAPQAGIHSLADIGPSHKNGISLNGLVEYIADQAGPAKKVLLPSVMNRVEQVIAGQIDLTVVPEPYGAMAQAQGAVPLATAEDLGVYGAVLLFSDKAIAEKNAAIRGFYAGYADAVAYIGATDPEDYLSFVIEKGEFAAESAAALENTVFLPLQAPNEEQFLAIRSWLNAKEDADAPFTAEFAAAADLQFIGVAAQ